MTIDEAKKSLFDKGNKNPSESEIENEIKRLLLEHKANEYQRERASSYPLIGDQLDYIYHNGVAKWKTDMIDPVKTKYPKG